MGGSTEAEEARILGEPRVPTEVGVPHNFYFVRARYTDSGIYPNWKDWRTDFPKADLQFLTVFKRLAAVDAFGEGLPIRLDDSELRRSPYLYAVEVGQMDPGDGRPHLGERRCRPGRARHQLGGIVTSRCSPGSTRIGSPAPLLRGLLAADVAVDGSGSASDA